MADIPEFAAHGTTGQPSIAIREAVVDDAVELAAAHVASWQAAYRGLLPQALLDGLSAERRTATWVRALQDAGCLTHVAVEPNGRVAGFIHAGASRDADCGDKVGELIAIYLRPELWNRGVGHQLHAAGMASLAARFEQATLWVLEGNARARAFYVRQGWQPDGAVKRDTLADAEVTEVRYRRSLIDR